MSSPNLPDPTYEHSYSVTFECTGFLPMAVQDGVLVPYVKTKRVVIGYEPDLDFQFESLSIHTKKANKMGEFSADTTAAFRNKKGIVSPLYVVLDGYTFYNTDAIVGIALGIAVMVYDIPYAFYDMRADYFASTIAHYVDGGMVTLPVLLDLFSYSSQCQRIIFFTFQYARSMVDACPIFDRWNDVEEPDFTPDTHDVPSHIFHSNMTMNVPCPALTHLRLLLGEGRITHAQYKEEYWKILQ